MTAMQLVLGPGREVSASAFFKAGSDLLSLLDEVSDIPIEWIIRDLRMGSAVAEVAAPDDHHDLGETVLADVVRGLHIVRTGEGAPPKWNPDAISAARILAHDVEASGSPRRPGYLALVRDHVELDGSRIPFVPELTALFDSLRPVERSMPGSVRGRLVGFNVSRGNRASLRPPRGRIIHASFDSGLREQLKGALLQDVELVGTVRQDAGGNIFHIRVSGVETVTSAGSKWVDLLGSDPDFTGGMTVEDYLEHGRGEA